MENLRLSNLELSHRLDRKTYPLVELSLNLQKPPDIVSDEDHGWKRPWKDKTTATGMTLFLANRIHGPD